MRNDTPLSPGEIRDLRAFAATMIPASTTYAVPGADDETILTDMLKSLDRDRDDIAAALARLAALAGRPFADLAADRRLEVATAFRAEGGPLLTAITRMILLCYYRDDRVMRALGQEPRSPFPKGHVVEQGDWSLLDPVKKRKPFWRPAS